MYRQKKAAPPWGLAKARRGNWRRPTFAQPIEALSSGLQRFTSVFGMGTGGSTALLSPEDRALLFGSFLASGCTLCFVHLAFLSVFARGLWGYWFTLSGSLVS